SVARLRFASYPFPTRRSSDLIPKLDALMEYIEDLPDGTKCSIWARFAPERERLEAALVEKYGRSAVVRFDGTVDEEGRKTAVNRDRKSTRLNSSHVNISYAGF